MSRRTLCFRKRHRRRYERCAYLAHGPVFSWLDRVGGFDIPAWSGVVVRHAVPSRLRSLRLRAHCNLSSRRERHKRRVIVVVLLPEPPGTVVPHFPPPFGRGLQVGHSGEQLPHFMVLSFRRLSNYVRVARRADPGGSALVSSLIRLRLTLRGLLRLVLAACGPSWSASAVSVRRITVHEPAHVCPFDASQGQRASRPASMVCMSENAESENPPNSCRLSDPVASIDAL